VRSKLHRALLAGIEALESVGLPYAVSAWATPRATQDVYLYAELPDAARPALARIGGHAPCAPAAGMGGASLLLSPA
jgi:hypothetical protein